MRDCGVSGFGLRKPLKVASQKSLTSGVRGNSLSEASLRKALSNISTRVGTSAGVAGWMVTAVVEVAIVAAEFVAQGEIVVLWVIQIQKCSYHLARRGLYKTPGDIGRGGPGPSGNLKFWVACVLTYWTET